MKIIISSIVLTLSGLQAMAQVNITDKEAQTIIDGVHWEKLGKRTQFQLANAKAECMTLSNYDNKVDFDCVINNSGHEVVLGKRDLESIIHYTGQKLPQEGLNLKTGRANMLCFMSGKCKLTTTLSLEEERHLYCNMTSHSRHAGSLLEKTSGEKTVIVESVDCRAEGIFDFMGNAYTIIAAKLKIRGSIGTTLDVDTFHSSGSAPGIVDEKVACQTIHETLGRNRQIALVERQLSDNEITSIRNTDRELFEEVTLRFPNNVILNGTKNKRIVEGAFCAGFEK